MSELSERLEKIRQQRGYLLPHHGLMATAMPEVLDAYDQLYGQLAFNSRRLSEHDHELIWLAILVARSEGLATHHVNRFLEAGGTSEEIADLLAVTAVASGCRGWQFAQRAWEPHVSGLRAERAFGEAFRRAAGDLIVEQAHLAMVSALTCLANFDGLRWALRAAYADDVNEQHLAHALALTMFPGSVPNFAQAARVWQELITQGEVSASEPFRVWAKLEGQGGFDEASGKTAG
ncbi:MAG: carboxymuconolactone decarboxylase family protein [Pseudomonadota bacterium]